MKETIQRMEHFHAHKLDYKDLAEDEKKFMDFLMPWNDIKAANMKWKSTLLQEEQKIDKEMMKHYKNVILNF